MQKFIEISPELSNKTAIFPGDTAFSRNVIMSFSRGDHFELSAIQTTLHIGAHADAPSHYHQNGETIDLRSPHYYIGNCQVIEVKTKMGARIFPKDFEGIEIVSKRILFKTNSFLNPELWNNDFMSLSPQLIEYLKEKEVILVGIDTPSVDPATEKDLTSHHALYKNNMAVLEGIILEHVTPGEYYLIAIPLRLKGADASPVRALLTEKIMGNKE